MPDVADMARHIPAKMLEVLRSLKSPDESPWQIGRYRINRLAQDQTLIEFDRGDPCEAYYGRKVSDSDMQSDASSQTAYETKAVGTWHAKTIVVQFAKQFSQLTHQWHRELESQTAPDPNRREDRSFVEHELVVDDNSDVEWNRDKLAAELQEPSTEEDWPRYRELILVAEDIAFTPEQDVLLAPRLIKVAIRFRDSTDPLDEPAVWSAIRTGASMLRPNESSRLQPLLEPGHSIETSLVALKMIGRIFEAQPPAGLDQHPDVATDVKKIADSLLNRYAIASSQSAAMAHLAIYALAAMGSRDTQQVIKAVRVLDVAWFTRRTGRKLRQLWEYWNNGGQEIDGSLSELLAQAMSELNR